MAALLLVRTLRLIQVRRQTDFVYWGTVIVLPHQSSLSSSRFRPGPRWIRCFSGLRVD